MLITKREDAYLAQKHVELVQEVEKMIVLAVLKEDSSKIANVIPTVPLINMVILQITHVKIVMTLVIHVMVVPKKLVKAVLLVFS